MESQNCEIQFTNSSLDSNQNGFCDLRREHGKVCLKEVYKSYSYIIAQNYLFNSTKSPFLYNRTKFVLIYINLDSSKNEICCVTLIFFLTKLKMFRLGMKRRDKNLKRMSEIVPNESPTLKRELAGQTIILLF